MPTNRPRYQVTDTGQVAGLLDQAARAWPELSGDRKQLLLRLARAGADHLPAPAAPLDDQLREHAGEWVAVADGRLLVAAQSPGDVARWLRDNSQRAEQLFRVPTAPADVVGEHGLT
jgi:hypothetical protein